MADTTPDSEVIMRDAARSLAMNQAGGYHRGTGGPAPIGKGSGELRRRNWLLRGKLFGIALTAIISSAIIAGIALDGIGFTGILATFFAIIVALFVFANFPRVRIPRRSDLNRGDARQLVARTELWLEHQRPALPAPAAQIIGEIGVRLDALGEQLQNADPAHPAVRQTRQLVGEYLPETIEAYRRVPANMRRERGVSGVPDEQLAASLGTISAEIEQVTRQLADGALDDLAIQTRFLEYKYGAGDQTAPEKQIPTDSH